VLQVTAVKAYYDCTVFVPVEPVKAKKNQPAIITLLDDESKNKPHVKIIRILSQESFEEINKALEDTQRLVNIR
jgi:hypothetical protein